VSKGIENSIVNFAKTGKLSVKDMFKSIVETILRSQVQQLLARTFGGMGGGGGSLLGNLFSAFVGGRSAGGPVQAGRAYRVGESGPETFVPTGGGSIVPGGGATMVTYNINAVDAASFRSLVASDPEFLFAVTEQGRRRMPNNRR
jgi:phage-related minor tail protein